MIVYARHAELPDEELLRALCVSNLTAIHQKTRIAACRLIAALLAQPAAGAAITHLLGGDYEDVSDTITIPWPMSPAYLRRSQSFLRGENRFICGCGNHGTTMAFAGLSSDGDGIVQSNVEETMAVIGNIASEGMKRRMLLLLEYDQAAA